MAHHLSTLLRLRECDYTELCKNVPAKLRDIPPIYSGNGRMAGRGRPYFSGTPYTAKMQTGFFTRLCATFRYPSRITVKMHVARFPSLFIQGARYVPKFREEIGLGDIWNLAGKVIKRQDKNLNGSFSEQKSATSDRSAILSDE